MRLGMAVAQPHVPIGGFFQRQDSRESSALPFPPCFSSDFASLSIENWNQTSMRVFFTPCVGRLSHKLTVNIW
jgi:hypothetical protein